ncbi:MAG: phosphatase PAP2 family protein [Candidatus Paceibacterota bacterium]
MEYINVLVRDTVMLYWGTSFSDTVVQLSTIINTPFFCGVVVLYVLLLLAQGKQKQVLITLTAIALAFIFAYLLKISLAIPRPEVSLVWEKGFGFPSMHATLSATFLFLFAHISIEQIHNKFWHTTLLVLSIILGLLIGFSRVFLQVHSIDQVIAGFLLGLTVAFLTTFIFEHTKKKRR